MENVSTVALAPRGKRKEDYLRTIYELLRSNGKARIKDIGLALGVSMPSVVGELKALNDEGLVVYRRGDVRLSEEGSRLAERVISKRRTLVEFLTLLLDVDPEEAEREACYLEHAVGDDVMRRIEMFVEFARDCPIGHPEFLDHLYRYYETGERPSTCRKGT